MQFEINNKAILQITDILSILASKALKGCSDAGTLHFERNQNLLNVTVFDGDTLCRAILRPTFLTDDSTPFNAICYTFNNALSVIEDDNIKISSENKLSINYNNGNLKLPLVTSDFKSPTINEPDDNALSIPAELFARGIDCCLNAVAKDDLRPQICGVHIIPGERLVLTATDGKKLCCLETEHSCSDKIGPFTLPTKICSLLKKIIQKYKGAEVNISINLVSPTRGLIRLPGFEILCPVSKNSFPNTKPLIEHPRPNVLSIDRDGMLSALSRLSACIDKSTAEYNNVAVLSLDPFSGNSISFTGKEKNNALEFLSTATYEGTTLKIGFNIPELISLLSKHAAGTVLMTFDTNRHPMCIKNESNSNTKLTSVLAPSVFSTSS